MHSGHFSRFLSHFDNWLILTEAYFFLVEDYLYQSFLPNATFSGIDLPIVH
jgi:hypothetical protein